MNNKELADQLLEIAKASLRQDIARLSFDGQVVTGALGLVSIDIAKAKMMVRRHRWDPKPFCYINLPKTTGSEALSKALLHPKLRGCGLEILEDMHGPLWTYVNIRLLEHPISLDQIRLSPQAAERFINRSE
jgi:hypothetical protein